MLTIEEITVGDALDRAAARWGDREGWIFERARIGFTEARERADQAARAFIALGFQPGDVVATWMSNRLEWLVLQFACAKAGLILTGLNTRFRIEETRFVLEQGDVKALFYMPRLLNIDFIATLEQAFPGLTDTMGDAKADSRLPHLRYLFDLDGSETAPSFAQFLEAGAAASDVQRAERQSARKPQEPVLMKFTSGTTSFPKGVLVQHLEALYWSAGIYDAMGIAAGEAVLNTQPFYHAGGSCGALTAPLTIGCKVVTPELYAPQTVLGLIERERCVAKTGSAAMYLMEMEYPQFRDYDLSSLRTGWCVGAPAVFARIRDEMGIIDMVQPFGATEAGGTCSRVGESWDTRTSTCGKPLPGVEMRIVDPDSRAPLPPGNVGEIAFRGWWRMLGYFRRDEDTQATLDADGWAYTGDLGRIDPDGNLIFSGRLKDVIRPGGENASAREIESFLLTHPAVHQVAVIPVPDDRLGEVVMAVVELRAGTTLTEAELIAFCRNAIATYKVPRHVRFVEQWPMTGSGKIQKFALRERFAP